MASEDPSTSVCRRRARVARSASTGARALGDGPIPMGLLDRSLNVVEVNSVAASLLGARDLAGRPLRDFLPDDGTTMEKVRRALESGEPLLNVPVHGPPPHRLAHTWLVSFYPVRDGAGAITGLHVVANEVSDLQRVEAIARADRERAERAVLRLEQLQAVTSALCAAATAADVARVVLGPGLGMVQAAAGSVSLVTPDRHLEVLDAVGYPAAVWEALRRRSLDDPTPSAEATRTGAPVWIEGPEALEARYPGQAELLRPLGHAACAFVPLALEGRTLGVLSLGFEDSRRLDDELRPLLLTLAHQCAQALERARLYEAERALRARAVEDAAMLECLISAAPFGFAFLDERQRYARVNSSLAAINGLSPGAHVGRPVTEVLPANLAPDAAEMLRKVAERGEPVEEQKLGVESPPGSGVLRDLIATAYPVRTPEGRHLGVAAIVNDVTALRRAERERERLVCELQQALRERDETAARLDQILHASPNGIAFVDDRLRYEHINAALAEINGPSVEEHLGRPMSEVCPHVERFSGTALRRIIAGGAPETLSMRGEVPRGSGNVRHFLANLFPVRTQDRVIGVGTVVTEITRLKQAEADRERLVRELTDALRERDAAAALLDKLFSAAPVGFGFFGPDLRVVRVNEALARINGLPVEAHAGRTLDELLPLLPSKRLLAEWRQALETGASRFDQEFSGETPASPGKLRRFAVSWSPIQSRAGTLGLAVVVRDVTAEREAEEFERYLLGIVSHDLRNPLASIAATISLLLLDDGLPAKYRGLLERTRLASGRMERIIRDLLDSTLVRSGRGMPLERRACDLGHVCRAAIEEAQSAHPAAAIRYAPSGDGRGDWDEDRLGQLVVNLLTNAIKHSPAGEAVDVRWSGGRGEVTLEFHNAGVIAGHLQAGLFEPFCGTARSALGPRGFGLGLYIAAQVVAAHGGTIEARSSEAEGTTFTVQLPRSAGA